MRILRGGLLAGLAAAAVIVVGLSLVKVGEKTPLQADVARLRQAENDLTRANLQALKNVVASFLAQEGRLPDRLADLRAAGLMTAGVTDAWGRAVRYERRSEDAFRLTSDGRDGKPGTPDDIVLDD